MEEEWSVDHRYVPQDETARALVAPLANMTATVTAGGLEVLGLWAAASAERGVQAG